MDVSQYLHMQLRLEGKTHVGHDRLKQVEIVPAEDMPLMLIAQLADKRIIAYYDEAVSSDLQSKLAKQIRLIEFPRVEPLINFLRTEQISFEIGFYKTYIFAEHVANLVADGVRGYSKQDPKIQAFGFDGFAEQVFAIELDSKIISACVSTREDEYCGEAWVYTDPEFRGQGHAQKVVSKWANSLRSTGKVPFYSHNIENIASASLANRLGLQPVFEQIVVSYTAP